MWEMMKHPNGKVRDRLNARVCEKINGMKFGSNNVSQPVVKNITTRMVSI